ncbi:TonB family C-terminal domain protein [Verrucomicrobiia bacterium DG1235]|nr:TonB family C-terminal domain protein [Verrucomicrobiae bacterium DG1235]
MSEIYTQSSTDTKNDLSALSLAGLCIVAAFALLPALSQFQGLITRDPPPEVTTTTDIPDFIIPDDPPVIIEDKKIDKPEIETPPPLITIHQLEMMITPGDGNVKVNTGWTAAVTAKDTDMEIFLPSQLDQQPRVLVAANPLYPYSMKGIDGEVTVEFIIEATGRVKRPRVIKSSHHQFEQAAINAVLKSKWQPGQKNGENVRTLVRLPINFRK